MRAPPGVTIAGPLIVSLSASRHQAPSMASAIAGPAANIATPTTPATRPRMTAPVAFATKLLSRLAGLLRDRINPVRVESEVLLDGRHGRIRSLITPDRVHRPRPARRNGEIHAIPLIRAERGPVRPLQQ